MVYIVFQSRLSFDFRFENGIILGVYKNKEDAEKVVKDLGWLSFAYVLEYSIL